MNSFTPSRFIAALGVTVSLATFATTTIAKDASAAENSSPVMPQMDAERGKTLFAERGCVICHSVNNVGSDVATSLDASNMNIAREPFEFFARMWRGAPQMLALQQADLGYQIDFSGQDIADIFAFVQSREIQEGFTEQDLPDHIKEIIDNGPSAAFE
ncbi:MULTISPECIES: c-type cytochrome [unclassified Thalassospira]|uniref:c-type cytochrome n=1 Tax=unclassified Thalassospira TaxID=2648997 RepID=UPI00257D8014|nr:c-type cytochrome [Thalassospira sp. UBA4513]|tara:strand:- start:178 stop:651 length:474 start_codon:yes stop_codon:yes gene_type:complete